jgi:cell division protein FtsN
MERRGAGGRYEFSLDNRSIAITAAGAAVVLIMVFAIGVVVGKGLGKIQAAPAKADYEIARADGLVVENKTIGATPEIPAAPGAVVTPPPAGTADAGTPAPAMEKDGVTYGFYDPRKQSPESMAMPPTAPPTASPAMPVKPATPPAAITPPPAAKPAATPMEIRENVPASGPGERPADRPTVPAPKVSGGPQKILYTVQVGAFPTKDEADRMKARLTKHGLAAYLVPATIKGATWYRVRVGKFADKEGARAMADAIQSKEGIKPFIDATAE